MNGGEHFGVSPAFKIATIFKMEEETLDGSASNSRFQKLKDKLEEETPMIAPPPRFQKICKNKSEEETLQIAPPPSKLRFFKSGKASVSNSPPPPRFLRK